MLRGNPFLKSSFFVCVFLFACLFGISCYAEEVVGVYDGDTIVLSRDGQEKSCHIYGVDAPEDGQVYYDEARQFLFDTLQNNKFRAIVHRMSIASYENCDVYFVNNKNNIETDIACYLIMNGYAYPDRNLNKNINENTKYFSSEKMAKQSKMGVWSQDKVEYPWDYRARKKIVEIEVVEEQARLDAIPVIGIGSSSDDDDGCSKLKNPFVMAACISSKNRAKEAAAEAETDALLTDEERALKKLDKISDQLSNIQRRQRYMQFQMNTGHYQKPNL